jgi:2-amino-4-hydroxy-6-hydroxymethyldihydropteridine diphosphokinase
MALVYASIGSNIDREKNIQQGIHELREQFHELKLSPVYETRSVGFDGDNFYNLVVSFETDQDVEQVVKTFRAIEMQAGRDRNQPKFSSRTLDIDLLLYDDLIYHNDRIQIPRDEITKYAFVLKPLVDLCGDSSHPVLNKTYAELWNELGLDSEGMTIVDSVVHP